MIGLFKINGTNSKLSSLRMSETHNTFLGNYNVKSVLFKDGVTTISAEGDYGLIWLCYLTLVLTIKSTLNIVLATILIILNILDFNLSKWQK